MKTKIAIVLAVLFSVFNKTKAQQTINATLQHDDLTRQYILYIPATYDPTTPSPLVMNFHGYSSNAQSNFNYTDFSSIADTAGFILINPQGALLNGVSHWNVGGFTLGSTVDDVGFVSALLDTISNSYNVDQDRIYSTGMSNGGYMSFLLACQLSDRIAAIASVTGSMTPQTYNNCNPQHPTPILQIHGTSDGTVPYDGSTWTKPIDEVIEFWVDYNNCSSTPSITNVPNINILDGSTVDHMIYEEGENCVTTEHFKIFEGDHDWPGVWGNMDIDASAEVWKFFSRYTINGLIECETLTNNKNVIDSREIQISPNPTSESISINMDKSEIFKYSIYSLSGTEVLSGKLYLNNETIDISNLDQGIYFLKIKTQTIKFIKTE